MYKISLMGLNDLEEAYKIELDVNPSPWKYQTFLSSFEVGHKGLICKQDDQIIGFIIFSPINPEAHILSISVKKEMQLKGIGTLLLKSMLDQCKVMNYKKIFLEVRVSNNQAINFYEKLGFSKDAIRSNYYTDNSEDALLMSLSI
jgi:ribosomal-protein-alanine N-acetyltransferase